MRRTIAVAFVVAFASAASLVVGCGQGGLTGTPSVGGASAVPSASNSTSAVRLSIANETTISVTLVVNGTVIETVPPETRQEFVPGPLPPLPWTVEARSPSGHTLTTLEVHSAAEVSSNFGRAVRADLSCGRIDIWAGPPLAGGPFTSGASGDCG